jgi:hypothetical protein
MNKPNMSLVLAALLATSGFAMAQTSPASAPPFKADGSGVVTTPAAGDAKTRADVKAGINAPNAQPGSPTQDARARSEASVPVTSGSTSGTTRADVKASVNAPNAAAGSPTQDARARSEASVPTTGGPTQNSRADVKAEAAGTSVQASTSTAAERKARRAERKAARKAEAPVPTAKETGGAASKTNAP